MPKQDYRKLEARAAALKKQIDQLTNKARPADGDRDKLMSLHGELTAIEQVAGEMKDAELAELRGIVDRNPVGNYGIDTPDVADFMAYIKSGEIQNASMSTSDANGGYIVPEPLHADLIEKVRKSDPLIARATHFDLTAGNDSIALPYKATHGVVANAAENGERTEQDSPTFSSASLTCYDYYTDQRASQLVLDSIPGAEELVLRWVVEDLYEQFGVDLAVGNGSTKGKGMFAETDKYAVKLSGAAGALANTNFMTLITSLHPRYRANAAFVMNSTTLGVCGSYVVPNTTTPLVTWDANGTPRIFGYEVLESASAPDIGAANHPIAFGDIGAGLAWATHRTPGVLRDPFTVSSVGKVRFYGLARLGSCCWDPQAIVLLKSNNS